MFLYYIKGEDKDSFLRYNVPDVVINEYTQ